MTAQQRKEALDAWMTFFEGDIPEANGAMIDPPRNLTGQEKDMFTLGYTAAQFALYSHRETIRSALTAGQAVKLDPDMPTQELLLHMGELSEDEILIARAAIRWANSAALSTL